MNIVVQRIAPLKDGVAILLFFLYFRSAALWIFHTFTSDLFAGYGIAFLALVLTIVFCGYVFRKRLLPHVRYAFSSVAFVGLLVFLGIDLTNTLFFNYQIVSAAVFLAGGYCLLGFYLEPRLWRRGIFLVIIVTLTLPFLEHVQTFLGFPVRILTAKVVSFLLHALGAASITESTVIITENKASIIDLPCSGVKSIYTGALFLCALYFFERVSVSVRAAAVAIVYFALLLAFNIWRVFSLVYIYDVLGLTTVGNTLHIALGIGGFVASSAIVWFLTKRYLARPLVIPAAESTPVTTSPLTPDAAPTTPLHSTSERVYVAVKPWAAPAILIVFIIADIFIGASGIIRSPRVFAVPSFTLTLPGIELNELPFTEQEKRFFQNREVILSKKYTGTTVGNIPFTLLLVSSSSWRTHHNPEVCLKGLGYAIERSELVEIGAARLRRVQLSADRGSVLYWYASGRDIVSDYSERVFSGLRNPEKVWTLVELGFNADVDVQNLDIVALVGALQRERLAYSF